MEENELPLARIRSVFKKWFPLMSVTISASRKVQSSKVGGYHLRENLSPIAGTKDSLKNTFPLDKKYLSLAGVSEKWKKLTSTSQKVSFHHKQKYDFS